ncbi:MAG: hypothetical protein KatS3mg077_1603 [Candidatus Binatia bacterium]|nr:MAG: hypothetical protein KatS3mg077_1603 [Candidatus Binatia bacterium]
MASSLVRAGTAGNRAGVEIGGLRTSYRTGPQANGSIEGSVGHMRRSRSGRGGHWRVIGAQGDTLGAAAAYTSARTARYLSANQLLVG